MYKTKVVKKKTRNRETLLRNLRKGKARLEDRCPFQVIPRPLKYTGYPQLYRLYADVILMEQNNTFVFESSLYNHFKLYKQAQILDYGVQKCIKFKAENRNIPVVDWKRVIDKLVSSDSYQMQQWVNPIRAYCERYEAMLKKYQELTEQEIQAYEESNSQMEKIRQNLMKTYPCIEFKSQLKDGQMQITEVAFSEKYIAELGHSFETFSEIVFNEGIPVITPLSSPGATSFLRQRLEKYLTGDLNGYQSPEFEANFITKGGYMKKTKLKTLYHACYEKGVPGFTILGVVVARQKPTMIAPHVQGLTLNGDFVDHMANKEKEANEFLAAYYESAQVEPKYALMDKICQIKEIEPEHSA